MADVAPQEFGHVDRADRVIVVGSLVFGLFRNWGVAMFFLIVGVVPAGVLLYLLRQPLAWLTGVAPADWPIGILVGAWFSLSGLMAIYGTWIQWQRLQRNRFTVDAQGIECRVHPWKPRRLAWSALETIRDTYDPDVDACVPQLVLVPHSGRKITLDGNEWPIDAIQVALARHFRITRDKDGKRRP